MEEVRGEPDLEVIDLEQELARREAGGSATPARPTGRRLGLPRGRAAVVASALGVLALLIGVWAVVAHRQLDAVRDDLLASRATLDEAATALQDGELLVARELMADARAVFADVPERVTAATTIPLRAVPYLSRTLTGVADIARGAELVAGAVVDGVAALDLQEDGLGALTPRDGRIPVQALTALAPALDAAHDDVARAVALVSRVPSSGLDPQVRDARNEFLALVGPLQDQLATANRLAAVVPPLFGADGPRRYLVLAANPTEPRGAAGFFGAYAVVEVEDGALSFSAAEASEDLPVVERGEIPWPDPSLEERYDAYGGTGFFRNLNMTADFPSAAVMVERYWAEVMGEPLDGVITVDPFAFESLLSVVGPVDVPGVGQVDPEEVVDFVAHDAYSTITDPDQRKRLIGLVATSALQGFLDNPADVGLQEVIDALAAIADRDSLLVHAVDPDEQQAIEALGLDGRLGDGAEHDLLAVTLNSGAAYKVDYWVERYLTLDVELGPNGQASSVLQTAFRNTAPTSGEPAYMIGSGGPPLDVGDALSFISVYCAPGCRTYDFPDTGFDDLETEQGVELGHRVSSTWLQLPAGRSQVLTWSYLTPEAWEPRGLDRVYRLHYDHQVTIIPTEVEVRVAVPEGFEASAIPDGAVVEDDEVVLEIAADRDLDLEFVFSPVA